MINAERACNQAHKKNAEIKEQIKKDCPKIFTELVAVIDQQINDRSAAGYFSASLYILNIVKEICDKYNYRFKFDIYKNQILENLSSYYTNLDFQCEIYHDHIRHEDVFILKWDKPSNNLSNNMDLV